MVWSSARSELKTILNNLTEVVTHFSCLSGTCWGITWCRLEHLSGSLNLKTARSFCNSTNLHLMSPEVVYNKAAQHWRGTWTLFSLLISNSRPPSGHASSVGSRWNTLTLSVSSLEKLLVKWFTSLSHIFKFISDTQICNSCVRLRICNFDWWRSDHIFDKMSIST